MHEAGDVRVEDVPDVRLIDPTDALVRVTRAAICGSDLWPYKSMPRDDTGRRMGHEFVGVVEAIGGDVETVKVGELVVSPFLWSDGSCVFCGEGLQSSCLHGGRYGWGTSTARRAKRCGCRRRMGHLLCCRPAWMRRSCLRCLRSPM
jgi:threonine dehydrogenase-like Zn-dependent dehydrogenase